LAGKVIQIIQALPGSFSWRRLVGLLLLSTFVSFEIYDRVIRIPRASAVEDDIVSEFQRIRAFPGISEFGLSRSHKSNQALVGRNYFTSADFQAIRGHYDVELQQNGWTYSSIKTITDWGRNFGGQSVIYCKRNYVANLFFPGERSGAGYTYGLDISWNLRKCE